MIAGMRASFKHRSGKVVDQTVVQLFTVHMWLAIDALINLVIGVI
jgi:hypothetical protein